jgi:hypothetical protein
LGKTAKRTHPFSSRKINALRRTSVRGAKVVAGLPARARDKQVDLRQHLGVFSSLIGTPDLQDIS